MHRGMMKKILSLLLSGMMATSLIPSFAYAAESENPQAYVMEQGEAQAEGITDSEVSEASEQESEAQEEADTAEASEATTQDTEETAETDTAEEDTQVEEEATEAETSEAQPDTQPEADTEEPDASEEVDTQAEDAEETEVTAEATTVTDYATFLKDLKQLEAYATAYVKENSGENVHALVINYIRTGVDRYTGGTWATLAGAENTAFTEYVAAQDAANETTASGLKNIEEITLPNGNTADLGHMFGTLDITTYASVQNMTDDVVKARADLGGWAGDTADMMYCAVNANISDKVDLSETDIDVLADAIRSRYLGAKYSTLNKVSHSFSDTDLYGDLDAYYVFNALKDSESIASVIENYFTASLSDKERAAYFLKNRLGGVKTKAAIRKAVYETYTGNTLMEALEASYGLSDLENHDTLQKACLYAFADYLFSLAGDDSGTDSGDDKKDEGKDDKKDDDTKQNDYYTVFSNQETTLAPGITQDVTYAMTADNKQIAYYTATVDLGRDDVDIYANYHDNDASSWAMSRVSDQMAAAQKKHSNADDADNYIANYNAVVGINADFYDMSTGAPQGALVMGGTEYHGAANENFFAILKDGTAMIGTSADYSKYKDKIKEAVGGSVYLVKDGKSVFSKSTDYYNNRVSRTCVGIAKEGKVIMVVLDGRQEPFSAGGSAEEIAQIMLDAGCVEAINLDGGGSSTFDAKQEGEDEVSVVNRPSDGYERSVSSSLMVVSTAAKTNTFDHALITSDADYLTVGASLALTASGVSSTGNAAALPDDVSWKVTDSSVGTIEDDVFTALKTGSTTVQLVTADGTVVGSKTLHVVVPDALLFTRSTMDVVYGEWATLPLTATYKGNTVKVRAEDIKFELSNESAGTIKDFAFTADETSGIRNVKVTAMLAKDYSVSATMSLALYSADEAKFDFDSAMYGDRKLAYNREVSNSTFLTTTVDDITSYTYYIKKANEAMVTDYTFALDMQKVEVPEKLVPLLKMVAGGDLDNVTAWDIMLQLAERVSEKTTVQIKIAFDKNVDVDYSNLKIVNDYFKVTGTKLDEKTNTLTVDIGWIKQSEAIDAEIANPIVIVSGISLTPKDEADWNADNQLTLTNSGELSYDIYLGANALYSMASSASFQQSYGIYPYTEPENTAHPAGGHFENTFRSFSDTYTLDRTVKNGWTTFNGKVCYYKDNEPLTGVQKLPGYQDEENSYYYDLGEDGVYTGKLTGFFVKDGKTYYARLGKLVTGWESIVAEDGESYFYYFDKSDGEMYTGVRAVDGLVYTFNDKGQLIRGAFRTDARGTKYFVAGESYFRRFVTLEEGTYWLDVNGYVAYGNAHTVTDNVKDITWYHFDEKTGLLTGLCNGIFDYQGEKYYCDENGKVFYGAIKVDGGIIFTATRGKMYVNQSVYVDDTTNQRGCALENGKYWCDEEGYIVKDGFAEIDGNTYYFTDYKHAKGFTKIGDSYYLFNAANGKMYKNASMWVGANDYGIEIGLHDFDADGKMVIPDTEKGTKKIVKEDGKLYFTIDGVKMRNGLYELDGDYYFAKYSGELAVSESVYVETKELSGNGQYAFDANGKLIKNGFIEGSDGYTYYYSDGVRAKGFTKIGDAYYLFNAGSGKMYKDASMWVGTNSYGVEVGMHNFGTDGKMVIPDTEKGTKKLVKEGDKLYFTIDGVKMRNGLYEIDGEYYFAGYSGELVVGKSVYVETKELSGNGYYAFDANGKLIKSGFIEGSDGYTYYYSDGVRAKGFTKIGDAYYLFNAGSGKMYKDATMWVGANSYGVTGGMYYFGTDGKMIGY